MTTRPVNHFVFAAVNEVSHFRHLLNLNFNLLNLHPSLITTLLISAPTDKRLRDELALQPKDLLQDLQHRFRVIRTPIGKENPTRSEDVVTFRGLLGRELEKILGAEGEGGWATFPCLYIIDVRYISSRKTIWS